MADTTPKGLSYLEAADPPAIHTITQTLAGDVDSQFDARDALLGVTSAASDGSGTKVRSGKSIIAAAETRTNTAYGLMTTPDRVQNVVLPTDGLLMVFYQALWQESVDSQARAAIFIGSNQLKRREIGNAAPQPQEAPCIGGASTYKPLVSYGGGLFGLDANVTAAASTSDVTTGQVLGTLDDSLGYGSPQNGAWGPAYIFAAAGTYDISIQFKSSSGSVTVKERKLWVRALAFS